MEKSCEGCGGANLAHRLRHTLRRLPRVLVLHMKRFKVGGGSLLSPTLRACIHTEWLIRHAGAEALQGEHSGQRHGSKHLRAMR